MHALTLEFIMRELSDQIVQSQSIQTAHELDATRIGQMLYAHMHVNWTTCSEGWRAAVSFDGAHCF
jgi:hypothetical protein